MSDITKTNRKQRKQIKRRSRVGKKREMTTLKRLEKKNTLPDRRSCGGVSEGESPRLSESRFTGKIRDRCRRVGKVEDWRIVKSGFEKHSLHGSDETF